MLEFAYWTQDEQALVVRATNMWPALSIRKSGQVKYEFWPDATRGVDRQAVALLANPTVQAGIAAFGPHPLLGADPEVFALHGDGSLMPAWEFLDAKPKAEPPQQFWDGFQAEFTIRPSICMAYMVDHVQRGLAAVLASARKVDSGAFLVSTPLFRVPQAVLAGAPAKFIALGCAPSLNVYSDASPLAAINSRHMPLRSAGCHIHLGFDRHPLTAQDAAAMVKAIDRICGITMVAVLGTMDDPRRRTFYGRAGEYRLPPHGLEYRTLSSAVLAHPVLLHAALELLRASLAFAALEVPVWPDIGDSEVQRIINECDAVSARRILRTREVPVYDLLPEGTRPAAKRLITGGAARFGLPMDDMQGVWHLQDDAWSKHSGADNCCLGGVR